MLQLRKCLVGLLVFAVLNACGQPDTERVVADAPEPAPVFTDESFRMIALQQQIENDNLSRWYYVAAANAWQAKVDEIAREEAERRARDNARRRTTTTAPASSRAQIGTAVTVERDCNFAIPCEIVMRESGGDYYAKNPSSSACGAYQMLLSSSNWAARQIGHPELVGVPACDWSPAMQDAGAAALWADSPCHWAPNRWC